MQDTPPPKAKQSYADALASEREHADNRHESQPVEPKDKRRWVRRGAAYKRAKTQTLIPGEPLFVAEGFPAKFRMIGRVKSPKSP